MRRGMKIEKPDVQVERTQKDLHIAYLKKVVDKKQYIQIVKLTNKTNQDISYDMTNINVNSKIDFSNKVKNDKKFKYEGYDILDTGTIKSSESITGCIVLDADNDLKTRVINSKKTGFKDIIVMDDNINITLEKGVNPREKHKNIKSE